MQQGKGAIQLQVGTVLLKERRKKGTWDHEVNYQIND
jgi:hypothetical protein